MTWLQVEPEFWTADVGGWALTVAPGPLTGQGWYWSVEPADGGLPTEMGMSQTVRQACELAEASMRRLAAMPKV